MKDLASLFAEAEKRITQLVRENRSYRGRVRELERELAEARREARELQNFRSKKIHIQEKVERILRALEAGGGKE